MRAHFQTVLRFMKSESGPTATEYGVLLALIAVGVVAAMSSFGDRVSTIYTTLAGTMPAGGSS